MGAIRVDYKQMEEIRKNKPIGIGKEGSCYHLEDDIVIKLYNGFFRNNKLYFDNLNDEKIAFPIDILFYENTELMVGYTMPYLYGNNLVNGFPLDLKLKTLKYAFIELKTLISKYKDIYMDDMCLDNIFYNDLRSYFSLIDTSRWYPRNDGYKESINDINWLFIASLLINVDIDKKIYKDKIFKELYNLYHRYTLEVNKRICHMQYDKIDIHGLFIEFLNTLEKKTSNIKEKKVKKIEDLIIK